MIDGERCLVVETEEDLKAAIMQRDLPFVAPPELARQFGLPEEEEDAGSIRDEEVIAADDEHGIAMVFTGRRLFRH